MSQLDEVEYARLETQVQEIEKLVNSGQPADVGFLLKNFLHNAKSRMAEIRQDEIRTEGERKDQKEKQSASIAQLVEMEHKLNAEEKQQYAGFLKLNYFTKANFDELDQFYTDSWDKLSESGKTQMSTRIWEGIKRHEYTFEELPEKVREKESERIYLQLTGKIEPSASLQNIPPQVCADFVREYEAGNEKATTRIVSGKEFAGYSPDTRTTSALQADASTKGKPSEEQKRESAVVPQDTVAVTSLAASGISKVMDIDQVVPPDAGSGGQTKGRG